MFAYVYVSMHLDLNSLYFQFFSCVVEIVKINRALNCKLASVSSGIFGIEEDVYGWCDSLKAVDFLGLER